MHKNHIRCVLSHSFSVPLPPSSLASSCSPWLHVRPQVFSFISNLFTRFLASIYGPKSYCVFPTSSHVLFDACMFPSCFTCSLSIWEFELHFTPQSIVPPICWCSSRFLKIPLGLHLASGCLYILLPSPNENMSSCFTCLCVGYDVPKSRFFPALGWLLCHWWPQNVLWLW